MFEDIIGEKEGLWEKYKRNPDFMEDTTRYLEKCWDDDFCDNCGGTGYVPIYCCDSAGYVPIYCCDGYACSCHGEPIDFHNECEECGRDWTYGSSSSS